MWQFLQTYGVWILFGVFFVFMIRMHMGGMGSMGGMHGGGVKMDRSSEEPSDTQRAIPTYDTSTNTPLDDSQYETVVRDINPEGKFAATSDSSRTQRRSHC